MKIQSQFLNSQHFNKHINILISGTEPFLLEQAYLKLQANLKTKGLERPHYFEIDSVGFNWQPVYALTNNGSLFDEVTFITLKSNTALKKAQHDEISQLLQSSDDTIFIIILPKLSKAQEKHNWVQNIEKTGLFISAEPIPHYKFPQLIKQRLQENNLQSTNQGYELLANSYEGNLLGLEQEIEKLSLIFNAGMISFDELQDNISDQSHCSLFQCVDFALSQNTLKAQSVLQQLKRDKAQPPVILWAITKELRTLINMKFDIDKGASMVNTLNQYHIWQSKKGAYQKQLQTHSIKHFYELLSQAKEVDCSIKGLSPLNTWQLLAKLLLNIAN